MAKQARIPIATSREGGSCLREGVRAKERRSCLETNTPGRPRPLVSLAPTSISWREFNRLRPRSPRDPLQTLFLFTQIASGRALAGISRVSSGERKMACRDGADLVYRWVLRGLWAARKRRPRAGRRSAGGGAGLGMARDGSGWLGIARDPSGPFGGVGMARDRSGPGEINGTG